MKKYIDIALNEISKGNFDKAIEISNRIIEEEPANPEGFELRGDCYYHLKKFEQAEINYNNAAELAKLKNKNYASQLYNKKGIAHLKLNNFREASEDFRKAVKQDPENYKAYNNRSKALRLAGEYEDAILEATRAINLKSDFAEAYNNRGSAYFSLSLTEECINDFTRALKLKPGYAIAYFNRGAAYFYLKKDYLGAKLDWEKAISLNPSYEPEVKEKIEAINLAYEKLAVKEGTSTLAEEKKQEITAPPEIKKPADSDRNISIREGDYLSASIEDLKPREKTSILEFDKSLIEDEKHFTEAREETHAESSVDEFLKEYGSGKGFADSFVEVEKKEIKEEKIPEPEKETYPDLDEFIKDKKEDAREELPPIKIPDELVKLHSEINAPPLPPPPVSGVNEVYQESVPEKPVRKKEKLIERYAKEVPSKKEKKSGGLKWVYIIMGILALAIIIMALITSGIFDKKDAEQTTPPAPDTPKTLFMISEKSGGDSAVSTLEKSFEEKLIAKNLVLVETDSGYTFQIGSFKDSALAVKKAEQLEEKGYESYIVRFEKDSTQILYRVRFGMFETPGEADSVASEFK
jgi:Flp pilus assembly protein TadD/cell division septation protein DedD